MFDFLKRKPLLDKMRMFLLPQDTVTDKGIVSLGEIQPRQKVAALDVETGEIIANKVEEIEKVKAKGTYYLIDEKTLLYENQSVMLGPHAIHAKLLKVGDELTYTDGRKRPIESIRKVKATHYFFRLKVSGNHCYFLNGILMHNASRFWVGGTGALDGSTTTHIAASSGGGGGSSYPSSSDDLTFDASSNATAYTVTTTTTATSVANLTVGAPTSGKVTFAGSVAINIFGSLNLSGGTAGITWTNTGLLTFKSTTSGKTITMNGVTISNDVTFDGVSGVWTSQDNFTTGDTNTITLINGSLDTTSRTWQYGTMSSANSNTRALNMTNSTHIPRATGTNWNFGVTTSNMTLTVTGSTIQLANGSSSYTFSGGGLTYGTLTCSAGAGGLIINGANTFATLSFTITGGIRQFQISAGQTITGSLTITGTNANLNRVGIQSTAAGTQQTITLSGSATYSISNADFRDIKFAGNGVPVSGTSFADCGGNDNTTITFPSPVTYFWVPGATQGAGNWSDTTHWATSSGGAGSAGFPLPHDNAVFDANSVTATNKTIVLDRYRLCKDITMAGQSSNPVLNSPIFQNANQSSNGVTMFGSLTMIAAMTMTAIGASPGFTFAGRSTHTVTSAGVQFPNNGLSNGVTFAAPGAIYTLQDDLYATGTLIHSLGTVDTNNKNVTCYAFSCSSTGTRNWIGSTTGAGTMTLIGNGVVWNTGTTTNLTMSMTNMPIAITDVSSTDKNFTTGGSGGGNAFGNLNVTGGGSGKIVFNTNSKSFKVITVTGGSKTFSFAASTTFTMTGFVMPSVVGSVVTLISGTPGTFYTFSCASGIISCDYMNITDCHALGGASYYAGRNSTDGGGNSGWQFVAYIFAALTDTITQSDNLAKSFTRTLTETALSIADTIVKQTNIPIAETISIVESFTRSVNRTLTESAISVTETLLRLSQSPLTDTITLADTLIGRYVTKFLKYARAVLTSRSNKQNL